jgi:hypothetical protein
MNATPLITLDVDWAPDFAIDFAASLLLDAGVPATWFITHDCPAVERLRGHSDLFELGIHPNFMPGSTHGTSESAVLSHMMKVVPEARAVRTHGLVQSSNLLERIVNETPIRVDASVFVPHARALDAVVYHWGGGKKLVRLPYMWEDDFEMVRPQSVWDLSTMVARGSGLMIMDFHPLHIYLNSIDLSSYRSLRQYGHFADLPEAVVRQHVRSGAGAQSAFRSAISSMQGRPLRHLRAFECRES